MMSHLPNGALRFVVLGRSLGNGLDRLRKIRSRSDVPVIITTGDRGDEIDPVAGLELGAFARPIEQARSVPAGGIRRRRTTACAGCDK
jgi:DNA-binding response OmpR family regulator